MTSNDQRQESLMERHGWKVLLVVGLIFALFGIGDIIRGMNADPAIAESITGVAWEELQAASPKAANLIDLSTRSNGLSIIILSVLSISITLTAFRQGERWAWYALWIWPLWNASILVLFWVSERQPGFPPPPPMLSAPVFLVITSLVLVMTQRKVFRKA